MHTFLTIGFVIVNIVYGVYLLSIELVTAAAASSSSSMYFHFNIRRTCYKPKNRFRRVRSIMQMYVYVCHKVFIKLIIFIRSLSLLYGIVCLFDFLFFSLIKLSYFQCVQLCKTFIKRSFCALCMCMCVHLCCWSYSVFLAFTVIVVVFTANYVCFPHYLTLSLCVQRIQCFAIFGFPKASLNAYMW